MIPQQDDRDIFFKDIPGLRHLDKVETDTVIDHNSTLDVEDYIPEGYHIVEDLDGARYVRNPK